jgi:hypothetical protein
MYILRKGVATLGDLLDGGNAGVAYPGPKYPGKIYCVNNITGSSGNSGEDWEHAMDDFDTAVTAQAAHIAARPSGDNYVRDIILLQGTSTAYGAVTAWPQYCDVIGIGADPRGNGTGIASITGSGSEAATGAGRGLHLYNLQFIGSGAYYAATFSVLFRAVIENCVFVNRTTGGLDITTGGGFVIRNCQIGCGDTATSATGLRIASAGGNFNNCLLEGNMILGSTTGLATAAYLQNGTIVRNNVIYGGTSGVADTSTQTGLNALAFYVGNFCSGTDAMAISNGAAARCFGNYVVNGTTPTIEAATIAEGLTS